MIIAMRLETSTKRRLRFGLLAIAALAFSIGLALGNISRARADGDDAAQNGTIDAAQNAHDAADAAQEALDSATQQRDQLESDGAPQDQIDEANQAVAQARAAKDAADEAAQSADEGAGDAQ